MINTGLASAPNEINDLRKNYAIAVHDSKLTNQVVAQLKANKSNDILIQAYLASFEALKAKHAWNPYDKLNYLKAFDVSMRKLIAQQPDNLEIRFLRFSIQNSLPSFLGLSNHLNEDKSKMFWLLTQKKYSNADQSYFKTIASYLLNANTFNEAESNEIKSALL